MISVSKPMFFGTLNTMKLSKMIHKEMFSRDGYSSLDGNTHVRRRRSEVLFLRENSLIKTSVEISDSLRDRSVFIRRGC